MFCARHLWRIALEMGRIMGLDIGTKRIGIALSDILHITAQGLTTYSRQNPEQDITYIIDLTHRHDVEKIICGLPLNMNGSSGSSVDMIKEFCSELSKSTDIPIEFSDERLSTMAAQRILIDADVSRQKRKQVIDKMAAVMILQGYLG